MKILINQQSFNVPEDMPLIDAPALISAKAPFAIALNKTFVSKNDYQSTIIQENDAIEIISPITGG